MNKFLQTAFTKIKDYFTANNGRKIFFFGLIFGILCFILYTTAAHNAGVYTLAVLSLAVAAGGTLWDSMAARYYFLKKVRDIQYEHLKAISDQQEAGEDVVFTPTFTDEEKRYLRRRKWQFVLVILFKVGIVIALFSLLLNVQMV